MKKDDILVETRALTKYFPAGRALLPSNRKQVKAVDGVSLSIYRGETLGLVGESGCGKSTFGRLILRLIPPTSGEILYGGNSICALDEASMREMRKKMQIIYQDPYASLNPRMTVAEIIRAPLDAFGIGTRGEREEAVLKIMDLVGLRVDQLYRYPHEFSGGQRQRVAIARSLILNPEFIVCDEPVSALDVSVRSQVINLMRSLQKELGLTYLFISHDMSVVKHLSTRIAVMYLGKILEMADKERLFTHMLHPYTQALMSAIPIPDANVPLKPAALQGDVPSAIDPPAGCRFHTRCPKAMPLCAREEPPLLEVAPGHYAACHLCR